MYILKNAGVILSLSVALFFTQNVPSKENITKHQGDVHSENKSSEEDHEKGITLSAEKISLANITVEPVTPKIHFNTIYAPGEVKANGYKSYLVSPRTDSVVISRHAALGEYVVKGQKLVTLFSESMVQAQADYLIASTEWQRVKKLDNKTVSESRLLQAKTTFNAAYGRLLALGLADEAIKSIYNKDRASFGQYSLIAQRAGVVLQDDFLQGQRIDAGDTIMLLADEEDLWVEAKVAPNKKLNLAINSPALVEFNGQSYSAKVIQEAHTINPITRTRIIRLSVENVDDNLHSGMFVKVNFQFTTQKKVIAVPEEALIRSSDGDWTVFVEDHPGEFSAVDVELGRALGDLREIHGIESGTRVVTQGAFFVASEIAKGGFDPHNH
ncbi:efflux RND transporter periplasmic adaptor subunit [Colwellia sp. RSH04]|uniref:efflux RND transporter periplasmic adaptor subunit n=1 Tax=Colwellia sp. RSH04 TaxID=2305464 RepID=UPI000E589B85|nr:efflux RND transporter periplasmic adaptor subunit [Colwellia sp. RSH04]RHW77779.1 efflux RND transporter periplasmic adaptor subunit [Colwellia sp. RSH04]